MMAGDDTVKPKKTTYAEQVRRANRFIIRHKNDSRENAESQIFWYEFLNIFGIDAKVRCEFERHVKIPNTPNPHRIDCFIPNKIIIEHKSKGKDLEKALKDQGEEYYYYIEDEVKPDHILLCNFETFYLINKQENTVPKEFALADLTKNLHRFKFLTDDDYDGIVDEVPLSKKASYLMGRIYDRLQETNYKKEDTEELLVRLVYCLFADDTGIFEKGIFHNYVKNNKRSFGFSLSGLFDLLDSDNRQKSSRELEKFPYINGQLFQNRVASPVFDDVMYELLLEASKFDWENISPAIFGSLFQSVMDKKERHDEGAHYTSEENIFKVIKPLFLDDLYDEFETLRRDHGRNRVKNLERFQDRLSKLKFLDPACGAGNFLIITYKEIRKLEMKVIDEYSHANQVLDISSLLKVNVDQFYGIELNKFSAKIAEIALWMTDHIMNNMVGKKYGLNYARIPLKKHPNIINGDALELDWNEILPSSECSYVFGNPPFGGTRVISDLQKQQIKKMSKTNVGELDYVAGWFMKSGKYVVDGGRIPIGFVATNSITQGVQVDQLWSVLSNYGLEIIFAYRSFKWESDARGQAHVIVVIMGLNKKTQDEKNKRLFTVKNNGIAESQHPYISPYLIGSDVQLPIIKRSVVKLHGLQTMRLGSKIKDGNNYIFTDEQKREFLQKEPDAGKWFRPYTNSKNYINNKKEWILVVAGIEPNELKKLPETMKRINAVKKFRENSRSEPLRKIARFPKQFEYDTIPTSPFLLIPIVSSEKREYVPIGYLKPPTVPSHAVMIIENATVALFGLLTSKMHMFWLRMNGGRLKSDLRYATGTVYNTFPTPKSSLDVLKPFAREILMIRKAHSKSTLADLYDSTAMPDDLRKAHDRLDGAVDKLYRPEPFKNDYDRLQFLLKEYKKMITKNQSTLN